jgi:ATP-binding cassette subfamily B protein
VVRDQGIEMKSSWWPIIRLLPVAGRVAAVAVVLNLLLGLLPLGFVIGAGVAVGRGTWGGVVLAVVSLLLQAGLSPFQAAFTELISRRVDGARASTLMRATLTEAPIDVLERPDVLDKTGDARRGLTEFSTTPGAAVAGLIALVARYAQLAGGVVITAVVLGPLAALVITAAALVARFGERGAQTRYSLLASRTAAARRKAYYILDTGGSPAAAKEIRVLGTLPWWRERGDRDSDSYLRPLWRARNRIRIAPFTAYSLIVLAGALAVLVMLRDAADRGGLSVLGLTLALQAILIPLRFGVYFPEADSQTQDGMRAHEAISAIERAAVQRSPDRRRAAAPASVRGIAFEKVSFAYPGSGRDVLRELDLQFPAGTSTAIVGLNGAGKTTLVKLLSRLYEPTGGRITVDGADLDEFDARSWQRRLAVIYQDYVRYELDAAANVGLGAPGHLGDAEALQRAIEWAGAAEVIAALPHGLATVLSSRYSGGVDLSGGQWQRIALARALFAVQAGASVLVLDEPTAQLDVRAEVAFFDRFLDVTRGLTTIVISHRFSTVRRADRIVVLDGGRITEQGHHDELVAAGGQYADLFELQARRFA